MPSANSLQLSFLLGRVVPAGYRTDFILSVFPFRQVKMRDSIEIILQSGLVLDYQEVVGLWSS